MQYHSPSRTKHPGARVIDKCEHGPVSVSETTKTRLAGWKTPVRVRWYVRKARMEGMGFQAAARPFDKAKHTRLAWERTVVALPRVLWLSAVGHELCASVLAGDEA